MAITMKSCSLVKPAKPTPYNEHISLSDCDLDKPKTHVPFIYFFKPSSKSDPSFSFSFASQTLKDALSEVLVHFYPLAGRLHVTVDRGCDIGLESSSAGAIFIEAESAARIQDFKDFAPTKELLTLTPSVDPSVGLHQKPLLLVQLTRFACGGISLGLAISRMMADGISLSHFLSEWARIARGESLLNPPYLDRTILFGSGSMSSMKNNLLSKSNRYDPLPLLIGKHNDHEERSKETAVVMLHLSVADIHKLKKVANEAIAGSNCRGYSRYEVVAAHIWRCACKARDHSPDQPTRLAVSVNFLERMSSLPKWYFGNSYYKTYASSTSGELTTMPLGHATSKIREVMEMVTKEYVKLNLDLTSGQLQPDLNRYRTCHTGTNQGSFVGNPNMAITSWMGVPLFGKDFGWGKEVYMGPASINFDGKSYILPGRNEVGSVTIALRLQTAHIDNFKKHFYEATSQSILSPHPSLYSNIISRY